MAELASSRRAFIARGAVSVMIAPAAGAFSLLVAAEAALAGWRYLPFLEFVLFWGSVAAAAALVSKWLVISRGSRAGLAESLGIKTGKGSLFVSASEFSEGGERLEPYSPFLVAETVRRAGKELEGLRPVELFSEFGKVRWTAAGMAICAIMLFQAFFLGEHAASVTRALLDPSISFKQSTGHNLRTDPRDITLLAGSDLDVRAVRFGARRDGVSIRHSTAPGIWRSDEAVADTVESEGIGLEAWRFTFRDVKEDFSFYFEAQGEKTPAVYVDVIHPPVINRIGATIIYPRYTGNEPDTIPSLTGRISALAGSDVLLEGETSTRISSGAAVFTSGRKEPLSPATGGFSCSFEITSDDTMMIDVVDEASLSNEDPVRYPVSALEDGDPSVSILSPGDEEILPRSMVVTVTFRASDDYGISSARLKYMKEGRKDQLKTVRLPVPPAGGSKGYEESYEWSLASERVFPGDRVLYFIEVTDNNTLTGPGYARSDTRTLVVPSMADIYARAREDDESRRDEMEDILDESREIRDRLEKLADDFRSEGKMDWNKREEGSEIIEAQRELREKIADVAEKLDETLRNLEENRMTSMDIGRKMEEIRDLLQRIENEDLRQAIDRLREMMKDVSESEIAASMEEMEMSARDMAEQLDRTIELLEQVLREEKMEEMMRRMEEMLDEQRSIRDSTSTGEKDELSSREDRLLGEYGEFAGDMEEFSQEMEEYPGGMEDVVEGMIESGIDTLMRKASDQMKADERDPAGTTMNETLDKMLTLYTEMGRCQMSMAMQVDSEVLRMVERSVRELIGISIHHEEFLPKLRSGSAPSRHDALLEEQLVIREAVKQVVNDLMSAARRSVSISNSVFIILGSAINRINAAIEAMENRKFSAAALTAGGVGPDLNAAAIELLESSSSSGGSGGSAGEKMSRMMQQQVSLNERLKRMMRELRGGSMSMEARARMARLAAEQRRIEELLKQIEGESDGSSGLLGKLDELGEEVREAAGKMERGELDRELLDRTEKILSRMLESQRSLNSRDYSRKRTSRTAGDVGARPAEGLEPEEIEMDLLLERIREAMREKGPAEYEELIKAYFRALSEKAREDFSGGRDER